MINYEWQIETPAERSLKREIQRLYILKEQYRSGTWPYLKRGQIYSVENLLSDIRKCEFKIIRLEKEINTPKTIIRQINSKAA